MKKLSLTFVIVLLVTNIVPADDLWIPEWRGESGTVWAEWDNWDQFPDHMPADSFQVNPPGLAEPYAWAYSERVFLLPFWEGRQNVLQVTADDDLVFFLDNYDNQKPVKFVRVQITYHSDHVHPAAFNVWSLYNGDEVESHHPVAPITSTDPPGWVTAAYEFSLEPNPLSEDIYLKFDWSVTHQGSALIDQVVIDTWCIPEPATLGLLLIGGLVLLRRPSG